MYMYICCMHTCMQNNDYCLSLKKIKILDQRSLPVVIFIKDNGDISHLVRFLSQCMSALYPRLYPAKHVLATTFVFET